MLFVWVVLWVLAFIILKFNSDNREMRWIASLCFFSGLGALCSLLRKQVLPDVNLYFLDIPARYMVSVLHFLVYTMAPYSMMVYCVITSDWLKAKFPFVVKHAAEIFLIPPILMLFVKFPVLVRYRPPFLAMSLWIVPYGIFSNFLLIRTYIEEKQAIVKKQKFLMCLLLTPSTIWAALSNYVLTAAGIHYAWPYHPVIVSGILFTFILASVKYGALGVKLNFEKYRLEDSRKTFTSGTAILNHTIKNEISKISMCTDNIKYSINNSDSIEDVRKATQDDFRIIELSSTHMLDMMKKINEHLADITLNESINNLGRLIDQSLLMVIPFLISKGITVMGNYQTGTLIHCDRVHIEEVLINVLKNSIEAMNTGGIITINIKDDHNDIIVAVSDNGAGIKTEDLSNVFDPFFSTKKTRTNFGLGLSYCYNVMQKHGGSMKIKSRRNFGTTVYLYFRHKRAIDSTKMCFPGEVTYGKDKSTACG